MVELKRCTKCKEIKLLEDFHKDKTKSDGRNVHCKVCQCKYNKDWRRKNKERIAAYQKNHREEHKESYNARFRAYRRKNPKYALSHSIALSVWYSLRDSKNRHHWEDLVGYILEDLVRHLEALFKEGMNWENYGAWHIDHKIPIAAFNFTKPEDTDFKRCWALANLQPLWKIENLKKSNKIAA